MNCALISRWGECVEEVLKSDDEVRETALTTTRTNINTSISDYIIFNSFQRIGTVKCLFPPCRMMPENGMLTGKSIERIKQVDR